MTTNQAIFERALKTIPGGVNSPVRAFQSVGGVPKFIKKAEGGYMWDIEGKKYVDYIGSWGPAIAGHANPEVIEAVQKAAVDGLSFGAPTEAEVLIAEKICELLPSIEQVRLVSSGTEATMSAIRLARGFTSRNKILKFEGCYHGHSDSLLVKSGSGLLTFGNPSSAGVPEEFVSHTIVIEYNNIEAVHECFSQYGNDIACVIVEPVAGNMNLVKPTKEFLQSLRESCDKHGSVLIFDEVMTGFRVGLNCAQGHFGIKPDITTLAKVIGGGMPIGAFGGRRDIMSKISPLGPVYQAGTLSGNPVAVAAGLKTLEIISRPGFYDGITSYNEKFTSGLKDIANKKGVKFTTDFIGGMFGLYFLNSVPQSFADVQKSDIEAFKVFFHTLLENGVHLAPSAFEAGFISASHDEESLQITFKAAESAFDAVAAHKGS
ncbi:glutamate-1-semialdehyde 2,1-aminomutase [Taylorella equigenitalis]|uniref:glutamate-1-semialdehyde 2,1-aminomutase n=1 Tax=Taylorella equigenitalis TaxID=29575 RepID=UPI00237CC1E4|nr:glutamate-1-semialdehyde 2,1-aminomutase [Taylorella equigenitalis]WDU54659.1 glutamate-1-semialdehyde 2,1-aminomutase [Taylorella equigenitalis]